MLPNVFVYAFDNGQAVPNYVFSIHCGPTAATNNSGRLMFGGACTTVTQVGAAGYCFDLNKYYWLLPPGNSTSRKFLRFKFTAPFDPSTLSSALVRYEPSTYEWDVPNNVPGFEWAVYDTRKALPACQGQVRQ